MIISELRVYNFRQFKSVDSTPGLKITFHKGLNALIGENDSGKTAVIDALKLELSFFCISANAGTGKTLLLYDIAKEILNRGKHVKIIHCGLLNEGHKLLRDNYGWDIVPIRNISS